MSEETGPREISLEARIRRIERRQRVFEKRAEIFEAQLRESSDPNDRETKRLIANHRKLVRLFRQLDEKAIKLYTMQEQSKRRFGW